MSCVPMSFEKHSEPWCERVHRFAAFLPETSYDHSSLKFRIDIHAAVDHSNNGDMIVIKQIKDQVHSCDDAAHVRRKAWPSPSNEREVSKLLNFPVDSSKHRVSGSGITLSDVTVSTQEVVPGLVGQNDPHFECLIARTARCT